MKRRHERIARPGSCVLTFCDTFECRPVLSCAAQSRRQRRSMAIVSKALEF
jgi:hypothetical protein